MAEEQKTKLRLEIAHVLFVDIVGYSKLLISEQSELLEHLKEMVRGSAEVRAAEAEGPSRTARKALGFDELLRGDIDAMKQRSRNYARRQLTWMRKMAGVQTIDVTRRDAADVAAEIGRRLVTGREVS